MPQPGQKTITLLEEMVDMVNAIADKNETSAARIVKLCINAQFGDVNEKKKAREILEKMIR